MIIQTWEQFAAEDGYMRQIELDRFTRPLQSERMLDFWEQMYPPNYAAEVRKIWPPKMGAKK